MDGFKDSTRMKYMTGGDVKAYKTGGAVKMSEGGTYNERGKRATMAEIAAEDRRMARRPSEGVSSRPTDASGRRATDAELGMTNSAKKPVGPSSVAVSKVLAGMTKPMKKATGGGVNSKLGKAIENAKAAMTAAPRAKSTFVDTMPKFGPQKPASRVSILDTIRGAVNPSSGNPLMGGMNRGDIVASKPTPPTIGKKPSMGLLSSMAMPTRGPSMSPAFNDRPMVRRKTGGLSVMPKGKR